MRMTALFAPIIEDLQVILDGVQSISVSFGLNVYDHNKTNVHW